MDDAEFLHELEKLEAGGTGRPGAVHHRTIDTLDDGLAPPKPQPLRDLEAQLDRGAPAAAIAANPFRFPPIVRRRPGIRDPIVLAVFLLIMAAVGAGAAVIVFYDRIAALLH